MTKLTKEQQLSNKLKEVEIREREANIKAKEYEVTEKQNNEKNNADKITIAKIEELRLTLCCLTFDTECIPGSEQKLKPMMDESEQQTIKNKIFEIIHKL